MLAYLANVVLATEDNKNSKRVLYDSVIDRLGNMKEEDGIGVSL